LENLLNDFCCKENLISDGFNTKFKHLEQKKWTWIFSMDVGLASSEYVEMLHWNHVWIPIQKGDLMVALHVDAPNVINNQNNLTIRELFVNWLIRAQEEIIRMSPRPQYITCFSHLATKLSKKYSIFANYSMNDIFQQQSGANKYMFRTYELLWFGREDILKEKVNQLKNSSIKFAPYGRQKIKNEIAIHKAAIALRKNILLETFLLQLLVSMILLHILFPKITYLIEV